ncbi:MAG: hypothetical protein ABI683_03395 [Ginsengibacter sp.]
MKKNHFKTDYISGDSSEVAELFSLQATTTIHTCTLLIQIAPCIKT